MKDWGESVSELRIKKNSYKILYTVPFYLGVFNFVHVFKFASSVLFLVLSCVVCDCCWLTVCIVLVLLYMCCYLMCICCIFFLLYTPDCWLKVSIRKVLRPATSTQVFLGLPASKSKCWNGSQDSKLPLHASHVALPN